MSSDILHSQELAKWEVERIKRGQRAIIRKIRFAHKNIIIDGTLYEAEVKRWTPNYAIYRRTKSFISIEEGKKYCEELGIDRNEVCYIIFLKKPRKVGFSWL